MPIEFVDERTMGGEVYIPLSSITFFKNVFVPFTKMIGCYWLPQVIEGGGFILDEHNKAEVLAELERLATWYNDHGIGADHLLRTELNLTSRDVYVGDWELLGLVIRTLKDAAIKHGSAPQGRYFIG